MKKVLIPFLAVLICLLMSSCSKPVIKDTIEGNFNTYYQMTDGTWSCDGYTYQYRLEIKGRLNNAVRDSVYVYLSNISEISFEQAWKASGLSSNSNDYFQKKDAVLVEMR